MNTEIEKSIRVTKYLADGPPRGGGAHAVPYSEVHNVYRTMVQTSTNGIVWSAFVRKSL